MLLYYSVHAFIFYMLVKIKFCITFIMHKTDLFSKTAELRQYMESIFEGVPIESIPLTIDNSPLFNDLYEFIAIFGKGSFGLVVKAIEKATGDNCAIKIIKKDKTNEGQISGMRQEVAILKSLTHKNVVKFREMHESRLYMFIVMEEIKGGSLSQFISSKTKKNQLVSDLDCSMIIRSILEGLKYIHNHEYIHRDLKPDNIMFENPGDFSSLKIVDFGLGIKFDILSTAIRNNCGTLLYMPYEQAKSNIYGSSVDIWACGVIMFCCLTGKHPLFMSTDNEDTYIAKLANPKWEFPSNYTPIAIDFFGHMCHNNPLSRYDTATALSHPWITRKLEDPIPKAMQEKQNESEAIRRLMRIIMAIKFSKCFYASDCLSDYQFAKDFVYMNADYIKVSVFDDKSINVLDPGNQEQYIANKDIEASAAAMNLFCLLLKYWID
jgi:serine/threonine protein kinase